jgi:hypothetical protein
MQGSRVSISKEGRAIWPCGKCVIATCYLLVLGWDCGAWPSIFSVTVSPELLSMTV